MRSQLAIVKANEEKRKALQLKKLPNLVARPLLTRDFVIMDEEYSFNLQPLHTMTALQVADKECSSSFMTGSWAYK